MRPAAKKVTPSIPTPTTGDCPPIRRRGREGASQRAPASEERTELGAPAPGNSAGADAREHRSQRQRAGSGPSLEHRPQETPPARTRGSIAASASERGADRAWSTGPRKLRRRGREGASQPAPASEERTELGAPAPRTLRRRGREAVDRGRRDTQGAADTITGVTAFEGDLRTTAG